MRQYDVRSEITIVCELISNKLPDPIQNDVRFIDMQHVARPIYEFDAGGRKMGPDRRVMDGLQEM